MKILQINCLYRSGSTGKIVYDHHCGLQKWGIESVVCYANGDVFNEPNVYKISSPFEQKTQALRARFTGLMYGGCRKQTKRIISVIEKENPDIVHLHCINGYTANIYKLVTYLKENEIKTVLTLHAELMHTANCGYALDCEKWKTGCGKCPRLKEETHSWFFDRTRKSWKLMKQAFDGFENLIVTSVSPWLMERAKQSPILANKRHVVVYNGLDTSVFYPYDTSDLREKHGLTNEKVVFQATSAFNNDPNHIKGGYYLLQIAERFKDKNVKFIVAGSHEISGDIPENVVLLGRVSDQQTLAKYYSMADVTLLTSKKETFSMICAESLCAGTPVVGFKAGAPEQISLPSYSRFVEHGNLDELEDALNATLKQPFDKAKIGEEAKAVYSKESMTDDYLKIYNIFIERIYENRNYNALL